MSSKSQLNRLAYSLQLQPQPPTVDQLIDRVAARVLQDYRHLESLSVIRHRRWLAVCVRAAVDAYLSAHDDQLKAGAPPEAPEDPAA